MPRALSKHTLSTVETYLEHGQSITGAQSKHTLGAVETYFEHVRNIPRAQSSTVEDGINIPRAQSKHIYCSAVIRSQKVFFFFKYQYIYFKHYRNRWQTSLPKDGKNNSKIVHIYKEFKPPINLIFSF